MRTLYRVWISTLVVAFGALTATAQSFRVQCPTGTITHPIFPGTDCSNPNNPGCNNSEPPYNGPTQFNTATAGIPLGTTGSFLTPVAGTINGAIKCQQISGGDGYSTMADGNQIFMFSFGPLSGLSDIAAGRPGTEFPMVFNTPYAGLLVRGDPATTDGATAGNSPGVAVSSPAFSWNGAVGLSNDITTIVTVTNLIEGPFPASTPTTRAPGCDATANLTANTVTAWTDAPLGLQVGQQVIINNVVAEGPTPTPTGYSGTWTITCVTTGLGTSPDGFSQVAFQYIDTAANLASDTGNDTAATAAAPPGIDGHVDPRQIMDIGVMNGNIPAPADRLR